jgi:hypothetical protein
MKDDFYEEEKKMRALRLIVDYTEASLIQLAFTPIEAYRLVQDTKRLILKLFPDKEDTYELIYAPRFQRIIDEKFTVPGTFSGRN